MHLRCLPCIFNRMLLSTCSSMRFVHLMIILIAVGMLHITKLSLANCGIELASTNALELQTDRTPKWTGHPKFHCYYFTIVFVIPYSLQRGYEILFYILFFVWSLFYLKRLYVGPCFLEFPWKTNFSPFYAFCVFYFESNDSNLDMVM